MVADILQDVLPKGKFWTDSITVAEGCQRTSPGCLNCWAEANHLLHSYFAGSGFSPDVLGPDGKWNGKVIEHPERLARILPKSNRRKPKVWTYWEDVFFEGVTEALQYRLFNIIDSPPDYHIVCTKRPERAVEFFRMYPGHSTGANLIILVTMENQDMVNQRGPYAEQLAAMGWNVGILAEPMLEPIYIRNLYHHDENPVYRWIIAGPENGTGKRPFNPQWAINLKDQAKSAGVPFFYKADKGFIPGAGLQRFLEVPDI